MFLDDLGQRLRERRELQRLTQLDVAQVLQVSPQAVSKWERGENAPDTILLSDLARVLGTTTDWLLGRHQPLGDNFDGTVLVSSVQGFTARCAQLQPREIVMWANGFLGQVTEATVTEGGIPVKYAGDSLLAFFAGHDHARRATSAAIFARNVVSEALVVGLASGPLHLAAVGHGAYAQPDIIGPTVNTAFRVNGWAAVNAKGRIGAALPVDCDLSDALQVVKHSGVVLKGLVSALDIVEITGRL